MKIALVNYRYFISGGPERYYFNIKEVLEQHGHTVVPFSIKNSRNLPAGEYERFFLDSLGDDVYFAESKKSPKMMLKYFARMFWSPEARRKFRDFLEYTRPDVVYIMQYHNKISPSIISVAHSMGIPVVHRISDMQYMCPNALFYNDAKGICEDCLHGKRLSCVRYRCVQGSAALSAIKASAKLLHDTMRIPRKIDAFVVPSLFTRAKLAEYGIPEDRLVHIPTFFNLRSPEQGTDVTYEPYILYVGRLEKEKGLMTLVKACADTDIHLKIIGFSREGYDEELKAYLNGRGHHVEFLGRMTFEEMEPYLRGCLCTVVPSEWYDNFPNTVLESYAYGKCVIATDIGSLTTMVDDGETGCRFAYGDADDLRRCILRLLANPGEARRMGRNGRQKILTEYSPEEHYRRLMEVFSSVMKR